MPEQQELIPRKESMLDIAERLANLFDAAEDDRLDTESQEMARKEIELLIDNELARKTDGVAIYKILAEEKMAALNKIGDDFKAKAGAIKRQLARVKALTLAAMNRMNVDQVRGRTYTINLMPARRRLDVFDVKQLPDEYVTIIREPDTDKIRAALEKDITSVPGAKLADGNEFLTFRGPGK